MDLFNAGQECFVLSFFGKSKACRGVGIVLILAAVANLTDSSIAAVALGAGPGDLMNDLRSFGYLFETMAVRDLRIYADAYEGTVSHYLEVVAKPQHGPPVLRFFNCLCRIAIAMTDPQ